MLNLINGLLFGLCGVLWIYNGKIPLALVWLAGSLLWFVRYFKQSKTDKEK